MGSPPDVAKTYHIHTYGCQMNVRDSETLAGWLGSLGYQPAATPDVADVILFNTCGIREHAHARVMGNIGHLRRWHEADPTRILGVCGCMPQQADVAEQLMKRFPYVSFVLGPQTIEHLPQAMRDAAQGIRSKILLDEAPILENQPRTRAQGVSAFVSIMAGCNNFCSYCVVPYVRGRERSREPLAVVQEVQALAADGVREVTLLGQNVNSYRYGSVDFSGLLRLCAQVEGILRIRFMTSNPHDFTDELIETMATTPQICRHVHLPVQSGNDGVLRAMNRRYTRGEYLSLVERLRRRMPDIAITTDFIVGFPGETDAAFEQSVSLVEAVEFDTAFLFLFSKRPGTPAATMEDQVPQAVIQARHARLLGIQQAITARRDAAMVGTCLPVLLENLDDRTSTLMMGRIPSGCNVHVAADPSRIGQICPVTITRAGTHTLYGTLATNNKGDH